MTALSLVVVLGLSMVGVGVFKPSLVKDLLGAKPTPSPLVAPEPTPNPVLAALAAEPLGNTDALRQQLDALIPSLKLGNAVSVSVVDLGSGQPLYERAQQAQLVPASNTKLVTAAGLLMTRGPAYRITTHVVAGAAPGEVVLVGAGDGTLSIDGQGFYTEAGRLDQLAEQVRKSLGTTAPTKVVVDGSLFPGTKMRQDWDIDSPDDAYLWDVDAVMINGNHVDVKDKEMPFDMYRDPEKAAGEAFAKLLGLPATAVVKGTAPAKAAGTASASPAAVTPGTELGSVQSAPALRLIEQMLHESDSMLAELLARQVALAKNKPATIDGVAAAAMEVLTELGVKGGFQIADGSGFSPANKISPTVFTSLFSLAVDGKHPQLANLLSAMATSGWEGTMLKRFDDAKQVYGIVRAKSGTLDHVNSISGVTQTANGRMIGFAVLADNVPVGQLQAQDELDKIIAALAACAC